jgi:hypothetical protein
MNHGSGRVKRLIAGGVLGLSVLALAPNNAGAAISTTNFCQNVPTGQSGFTDIAAAGVHQRNVECLKGAGLTSGTTATTYSPQNNVSRGQMATFIANMIDLADNLDAAGGVTVPSLPSAAASADRFTDDETSVHEGNINRLAQANVVQGTSATTFSPDAIVSRAQMASFIAQALAFIQGSQLAEGADAFTVLRDPGPGVRELDGRHQHPAGPGTDGRHLAARADPGPRRQHRQRWRRRRHNDCVHLRREPRQRRTRRWELLRSRRHG